MKEVIFLNGQLKFSVQDGNWTMESELERADGPEGELFNAALDGLEAMLLALVANEVLTIGDLAATMRIDDAINAAHDALASNLID